MSTSGNLDDLVERVLERARQDAASIVEIAGKAAERELRQAEELSRKAKVSAEQAMQEGIERRKHVAKAESFQNTRRAVMNARESVVEAVFAAALEDLAKIEDSDFRRKLMVALVREGVQALKVPSVRVSLNATELALVQASDFPTQLDGVSVALDTAPIETRGGPVITDDSGRIMFENTFEARLDRNRDSLRKQVAEILRLHDEEGAQ